MGRPDTKRVGTERVKMIQKILAMKNMLDLGRSMDSSHTGSRDLLEVVLEKKEDDHQKILEPRLTSLLIRNNVDINRPTSFCRRSPNLSRQSLASDPPESEFIKPPCLNAFIHSLGLLSMSSLVLAALSFFVMNIFVNMQSVPFPVRDYQSENNDAEPTPLMKQKPAYNSSTSDDIRDNLLKAGFALTSFITTCSLICLMVCSMQCFFTSKILKTAEGDERAHKFIRECSSSRVLAITGFYLSIPVFLIDIVLLLILRVSSSQAVIAGIILGLGVLFCVLSVMQNCYHWRVEKSRADGGLPVYDSHFSFPRSAMNKSSPRRQSELCTLV